MRFICLFFNQLGWKLFYNHLVFYCLKKLSCCLKHSNFKLAVLEIQLYLTHFVSSASRRPLNLHDLQRRPAFTSRNPPQSVLRVSEWHQNLEAVSSQPKLRLLNQALHRHRSQKTRRSPANKLLGCEVQSAHSLSSREQLFSLLSLRRQRGNAQGMPTRSDLQSSSGGLQRSKWDQLLESWKTNHHHNSSGPGNLIHDNNDHRGPEARGSLPFTQRHRVGSPLASSEQLLALLSLRQRQTQGQGVRERFSLERLFASLYLARKR